MARTVERSADGAPSPKEIGRQLRNVRRKQGLSRVEVARSAGLTRRELAAYERGRVDIPESDLWCLAGSCGVDVSDLLPHRDKLVFDPGLSSLAIGDTIRHLRSPGKPDGLLREYLSMIYELRNLPPGSAIPLRAQDLSALADALGGSPDVIEQRLRELIGADGDEAARLRSMILPPLQLPPPGSSDPGAVDDQAPTAIHDLPIANPPLTPDLGQPIAPNGDHPMEPSDPMATSSEVGRDDFFATPRAPDPFAPPPPLDPVPMDAVPLDPFALPPDTSPVDVADALARLRDDPFAPPGTRATGSTEVPPLDGVAGADTLLPFDPIPVDLPRRGEAADPLVAPHTVLDVPVGSDDGDDVAASVTPIIWRAPGHADLDAAQEPLDAPDTDPEGDDDGHGARACPALTKAGTVWEIGSTSPTPAIGDGRGLALRRAEHRWALCDLHAAGDFTAKAVVDFTAGTGFGIVFRASVDEQEQIRGYSFDIDTISGASGYVVRQWDANRPYWRPLAQAPVTDPTILFGRHTIMLTVVDDALSVDVDGQTVLTMQSLTRASIELHQEPCQGDRLGIQAEATTDITVDEFAAASH